MRHSLSFLIIGAGGVTSYMLPALNNSVNIAKDTVVFDKDILEPKNLDRQLFDKKDVGKNKAKALFDKYKIKATVLEEFLCETSIDSHISKISKCDMILCAVDNHPARRCAFDIAEELNIPLISGANEYSTSQAFVYLPQFKDTKADPRVRYPEILTDNSGSPIRCTGDALESTPQLAIANFNTASLMLQLLWHLLTFKREENGDIPTWLPIEFQTTLSRTETITFGDIAIL